MVTYKGHVQPEGWENVIGRPGVLFVFRFGSRFASSALRTDLESISAGFSTSVGFIGQADELD